MFSWSVVQKIGKGAGALGNWVKLSELARQLERGEAYVKAGVIGDKAAEQNNPQHHVTNAEVALFNEYGTVSVIDGAPNTHTPPRSFIGDPFRRNKYKFLQTLYAALPGILDGSRDVAKVLSTVGLGMEKAMKGTILGGVGIPPPNAPATIVKKGSSRPLVDESVLIGSITHAVHLPGEPETAGGREV